MEIIEATVTDRRVARLVTLQKQHADTHTPPGSGHALDVGVEAAGEVLYFLALENQEAVGCIGLRRLSAREGEVKTLHVVEEWRGQGVAKALLERLTVAALGLGIKILKLETGRSDGFAASRRFYSREGFEKCERFGPYRTDPFSFCMKKAL